MRILPEVCEESSGPHAASGQVSVEAPARHGDIQMRRHIRLRGGRECQQNILPESLPPRQVVPGPQDVVLRCGTVFVLCANEKR